MSEDFSVRLFQDSDLDEILALWRESGWGELTAEQWRTWYRDAPCGPAIVPVVVSNQEVVGHLVLTPANIVLRGKAARAVRMSAVLMRKDTRTGPLRDPNHPTVGLLRRAFREATERGYDVLFSLPHRDWLPFLRFLPGLGLPPFTMAEFECHKAAVTDLKPVRNRSERNVQPVDHFGADYDLLWQQATSYIRNGVARSAAWLNYKNGGHTCLEVRESSGDLLGFAAVRKDGLIADLLARNENEIPVVLGACADWWRDHLQDAPQSLTAMRTTTVANALEPIGFRPIPFRFAFAMAALRETCPLDDAPPDQWYLTGGD